MSLKIYLSLFLIFSSLCLIQGITSKGTRTIEVPIKEARSTSEPRILIKPMHSLKSSPPYPPLHLDPFLSMHPVYIANAVESGMIPQLPFNPFPIYTRLPSQPITSQIPTHPYRIFSYYGMNPITQEQLQASEREGKIEEARSSKILQSQSNTPPQMMNNTPQMMNNASQMMMNSTSQMMNNTEMELMNNSTLEQVNTTKPIEEGERTPAKPIRRTRIRRAAHNICYREHNCRGSILELQLDALHCRNRHGQSWKLTPASPCVNVRGRRAEPQYWLNDNEDADDRDADYDRDANYDRDGNYDDVEDDDAYMVRRRSQCNTRRNR